MTTTYKNNLLNGVSRIGRIAAVLFIMLAAGFTQLNAQVSTYTFSQSAGTYTPITGGTVLGTATNDDNIFANNPIGFQFCYNGTIYTEFGVNANGWIYMGNGTGTSSYTSLSTGSTNNVISGFNFDLQGEPTTGELRYQTIGTAPNRTLVVQFTNYDAWSSTSNSDTYNFQIRLNETSNQIDIVYGNYVCNAAVRTAQVGLRGASSADFNNVSVSNGLQTWATAIAGTANTATCEINNTPLVPTSGQTYSFAQPAAPVAPVNLVFTGVSATGMTLTWDDASTNEANFFVYRSTDNINFTLVNTQASTSSATTGTQYTYSPTGLFSGTTYYWRVLAGNANCGGTPLTGNQTTLSGTMCGVYTIGPTGAYPSLTAAVAAVATNGVNCPLIFEFQAAYVSTVETFPIVIPFLGNGPATTITARPELGATNLSITSSATQTIDFSGATYFSFDGRPGGVGSVSELTIDNSSTTGNAVRFINDAQSDGLNFMKIRGVNTSVTSGVINFGNAASSGNSNNFITNSDLTSGATNAAVLIYGSNSIANTTNSNNTISNNMLYNWFGASVADAAISITGNSAAWTISNNSFYQTATRTYTSAVTHFGMNINTSTGNISGNFVITGNFIGGSAANCGGSAWTGAGSVAHRFIAMNVTTGSLGANSIQGNTITNFNFTTTSGTTTTNGIWCGINLTGTSANMNVGTILPNVIGSNTTNGQIVTTTSTTGGMTVAINSSASGNININGNMIGGITANGSSATISSSIYGILISSGFPVITNNIIGSITQTNSLVNAVSTSTTGGHVTGINSSAFSGAVIITGNTIANLTNQYAGTSTTGTVRGIITTSGMNTISGNTIAALSNLSPQAGTTTASSVTGIGLQSTSTAVAGPQKVFGNTIGGLANGSTTGNVNVNGILVNSSTSAGFGYEVYNNSIQGIGAPLTSGTSVTSGIQIYGGSGRVYNNMIVLGVDPSGTPLTQSQEYDGIYKNTANRSTIMFNSVSITGSGVTTGTANTYAFRLGNGPSAAPLDSVYNNVFSNTRSNGTGTGTHYAIQVFGTSGMISNSNDFYGNGTGYQMGAVGTTNYAGVAAWTSATTFDANSYGANPMFTGTLDLHINNPGQSPLESGATPLGISFDLDNQVRPGPTAVNGGGTAPDIGADEFDGFPVTVDLGVQLLVSPADSGCYGATETVRVRIKNYATVSLDMSANNVTVNGNVTGPNPATFGPLVITSGIIPAGGTIDTAIGTNYNMTAAGTYVFNASTTQVNDFVGSNDAMAPVTINVSGGVAVSLPSPQCSGSAVTLTVSGQTNGGSIQWQESADNITWTNIVGATTTPFTVSPTDTTYYRSVSCGLHNSVIDTVITISLNPPTTIGDTRCGPGTVNLSASGSGTLEWYTTPTGGSSVNSGSTFSPSVTATTTYYVEDTYNSAGTGTLAPVSCYPTYSFACSSNDYIDNFSTTGGITNISNLGTGCNGSLPTNTTFFPSQIVTSTPGGSFNISAQAGSSFSQGMRLWIDFNNDGDFADSGEDVWSAPSSTTVQTGVINVPANTTPGPKRMRLMCRFATVPASTDYCLSSASFGEVEEYTLVVGLLCTSSRTPVTATVTPPPAMSVSTVNGQLCGNDSTLLTINSGSPDYVFTWSPATYLSSTSGDTVTFHPLAAGYYSYVVNAVDTVTGCTATDTISGLSRSVPPQVLASTSNDSICGGTTVTLNAAPATPLAQITNGNVLNTNTTYPAPYGNWYGGSRHQMLILASELTAAGLNAGYISGLQFQITNIGTSAPLQNFTIDMEQTNLTSITTFDPGPFTTVYTNALYTPTVGFNTHTFNTPFYWDGVSNIIVQTCFNNLSFTQNCVFRQVVTPFTSTVYYRNDNEPGVCTNLAVTASIAQRPNIAFLVSSASWTYNWTPVGSLSSATVQNPDATPVTTTNYVVTVTDTLTGCSGTDTVQVYVKPTPAPNLGPDTIICSNQPLLLDGTAGNYTYLWQDNSTAQTYSANVFGNYYVLVTDTVSGCSASDTVLVGVNSAPAFSLGSDVTVCAGTQVTFSGPSGQYLYNWNTADTTQTITTGTGGSYELTVTDSTNGCAAMDTVLLNANPLPAVALGNDTAICSASTPLILSGPAGNYTYDWSDNSTNQTLAVTATGSYYVVVTDTATTCFSGDTILVNVNTSPVVNLGNDSTLCGGSVTLVATPGPYNYLWSDNSTNGSLVVTSTMMVDVVVTDSINGCAAMDTVNITINTVPVFSLGNDTSLCGGTLTLNGPSGNNIGYMWQDNSTNQSLVATATGQYYLAATDTITGCAASDSVNVTINTPPNVTFTTQSTACTTDPAIALTGSPAGGIFSGPGVTGSSFNPATAGVGAQTITYDYTDANGCSGQATSTITVSACVGITEPFIAAGMNVYPNPNDGYFTLTIKDADYSELSVEVVTIEGKVVYSDMASNVQGNYVKAIDLTNEANGIYFLRITANGQTFMQKIVKND